MKIECNNCNNDKIITLPTPKKEGEVIVCEKCGLLLAVSINYPLTPYKLEWGTTEGFGKNGKPLVIKIH